MNLPDRKKLKVKPEPLFVEWLEDCGTWYGTTDPDHVEIYRDRAEAFLQESPFRYYHPKGHNGRIRVSYYEGM